MIAEMIRIERQRVRPVDVLAADGSVDVDAAALVRRRSPRAPTASRLRPESSRRRAGAARQIPFATMPPTNHPSVRQYIASERSARWATAQTRKRKCMRELDDALGKQLAVGERLEVEERQQVDDREEREEEEQNADRPWEAPVGAARARRRVGDEEHRGGDVGDVHVRPAGGPAHLGQGDREDVGEEQGVGDARSVPGPPAAPAGRATLTGPSPAVRWNERAAARPGRRPRRAGKRAPLHARRRDSRAFHSGDRSALSARPPANESTSRSRALADPARVVRSDDRVRRRSRVSALPPRRREAPRRGSAARRRGTRTPFPTARRGRGPPPRG